jgi:GAF domain-containing protein
MLIHLRAAALTTGMSILASLGLAFASRSAPSSLLPLALWAIHSVVLIAWFILLAQYIRYQQQTIATALENQRKLTQHNYELQEQQDTLARRISERTSEVSQYLLYMQTATEISQLTAAHTNRERIMQEFVELLQMRFGLYYAGLFLIDRSGQWAVLQAGTGETGRAMLARHHKIEIGSGMIGWSVANARPRVAGDVSADAIRLPTSELPNTRSEAAIPMRALGQVIGAITVQSTRPNSFDQELVTVLQNYADMLAATLENIRMEQENQTVRQQELYRQRAEDRASWRNNLGRRGVKNVIYDRISVSPVDSETNPAIKQVKQTGEALVTTQNGSSTAYIPVQTRNQTIGVLTFRKPAGETSWSDADVRLLAQLAHQLGDTLDNARLYQSIQRQAAQEQLLSEMGSRLRETLDVDTVLRTAADEIFQAMQLDLVTIELVEEPAQPAR